MPAICLMYHRVGRPATDPWSLFVSPENFEDQVAVLTAAFDIVDPGVLTLRQETIGHRKPALCLTFDDGYEDNFLVARPILEKYRCPATFFIPTAFIGSGTPFWWDTLEAVFLRSPFLPASLRLMINSEDHLFHFITAELSAGDKEKISHWKWYEAPPCDRCSAFLTIWNLLRGLPAPEQARQLAGLVDWAAFPSPPVTTDRPMSSGQLEHLSRSPLFTIGLHTHTHCDLTHRSAAAQREEIQHCQQALRAICNVSAHSLAFPFGKYNADTFEALRETTVEACFTTGEGLITPGADPMQLDRCQVFDWPGQQLGDWLAGRLL